MFQSPIVDVAFGLMSGFFAVSLAAGILVECFASITKWRSRTLLSGLKTLMNDPDATGLVLDLYRHAAISPRDDGTARTVNDLKNKPAYIDGKQFANALFDIVRVSGVAQGNVPGMLNAVTTKLSASQPAGAATAPNAQLNQLLTGIISRAQGDFDKMRDEVAHWFDNGMDRLSGAYKRWTQLLVFVLALLIAVLLNIDSISIAKVLWQHPTQVESLTLEQVIPPEKAIENLSNSLPVGWTAEVCAYWSNCAWSSASSWVPATEAQFWQIGGWLITALASIFGAPFWFDLLQRVARLKGSGPSPADKTADRSAAA